MHSDLLRRWWHRAQLSCRTICAEPAAARPLSPGAGLESRRRHPGLGPHQPDQPGAAAALPSDLHRSEGGEALRSEEHTSELQSLMRTTSAVFCLQKQNRISDELTRT